MTNLTTKLQSLSLELEQKKDRLYKVRVPSDNIQTILLTLLNEFDYITLDSMNTRDDLEDGLFTMTYCLQTEKRDHILMVQTSIDREIATTPTMYRIWPQAEIMEREAHEMFGIDFPGHPTLIDFALEFWEHMPPMRRDFDTLEFVNSLDPFRGQRDDNLDTKVEMKRIREEKKAQKLKEAEEQAALEAQNSTNEEGKENE